MLETLTPGAHASAARVALFDFDGTLSLIRTGWVNVMIPMMVEVLEDLNTGESKESLYTLVEDYVGRLTGKETIYQMMELADQVRKRGGSPQDPKEYKAEYLRRLHAMIADRLSGLREGSISPDSAMVPGSRQLLEALRERGLTLYLASGTDHENVVEEAKLLKIDHYFNGGVYGALEDLSKFSKALLVQQIVERTEVRGNEILGFGDGYVEIEVVKQAGGTAVGIASDEPACEKVDDWKRQRLARVGADFIVPNYKALPGLLRALFPQ